MRKYLGLLDLPLSLASLGAGEGGGGESVGASARLFVSLEPGLNYRAMQAHFSQFVWYRRLFVLFSRYTFINTLVPMEPSAS